MNAVVERAAVSLVVGMVATVTALAFFYPPASSTEAPRTRLAAPKAGDQADGDGLPVVAATGETSQPPRRPLIVDVVTTGRDLLPVYATVRGLAEEFRKLGYTLDGVRAGDGRVPRFFLDRLPHDLGDVPEVRQRKELFFKSVLPIALRINEEILADRRRLWRFHFRQTMGWRLGAADRLWLIALAERYRVRDTDLEELLRRVDVIPPSLVLAQGAEEKRYRVRDTDLEELLRRVDVIPPSLVLAQGAEESGWGTSRFAREGNAIFGQWTFAKGHLVPRRRDAGKTHEVRAFPSLLGSVRAYARNLNTHRAYRNFRSLRETLRRRGETLEGAVLAGTLIPYCEQGPIYVRRIRGMIRYNRLERLDGARLREGGPAFKPLI